MDADALLQDYKCMLCHRLPLANTDIILAEDGFVYHRRCMKVHIDMTVVGSAGPDRIVSPVTKKNMGSTLITPKTIKFLIEKLSGDDHCCASQIEDEKSGVDRPSEDKVNLNDGDLLAQKGYNTYFGCNGVVKNQSLGFELLVEAASEGGSAFAAYKLGSMYLAGVHGFKFNGKRAKRWLTLAKELSTQSGLLGPSEVKNIECYLNQLQ